MSSWSFDQPTPSAASIVIFIMENVIYPTIDYLEMENSPYIGILGVNGIITEDGNISILGYQPFMQDSDCSVVLSVIDENL